ncbi:MAG: TonB-dependent receptor [Phenylobacterium sp.]|uniref:TonB-dependent receptor n=1 Tax=Phenylobacterium sp. TaxID=1871053 RepID=UPI00260101DF|nr:TonB-dependent receptor [Phenylobacterium sp.]MCG9915916.1 TonB-dependent receptor [Phenylobacterium sp.]
MYTAPKLRRVALAASASTLTLLLAVPAVAQTAAASPEPAFLEELVVTAQRREERLQDVPISVSAFSQDTLQAQGIVGGPSLQLAVPNVTFAKSYYSGYNFQIRGIGTKQTSVTGDSSTGVHFNGAPLTANRLFEAEFFDVERVEVLRGPQGTLYGRNATGGVVNVISARPTGEFEGMLRAEVTNFDGRKLVGMVNIPLTEQLGLRLAGTTLNRDGFVKNLGTNRMVDDRDLYSIRASLRWQPTSTLDVNLAWQHFEEEDSRLRTGKALCTRDNGPSRVGATAVTNAVVRGFLSQGCADASVYTDAAYGTPNSLASLYGIIAFARGLTTGDLYGNVQPRDLSVIDSAVDPTYRAREDVFTLNADWQLNDNLQFSSLTAYSEGRLYAGQEENRFSAAIPFNSTPLAPGGVINDPQLGSTNRLIIADEIQTPSRQWSQEFRLQSSFEGPLNFSLGALALRYDVVQNFYIFSNAFTYAALAANGGAPCALNSSCVYINPSRELNLDGRGNYLSHQPYHLDSNAVFGEVYYELSPDLKLTGGLRYTEDKKTLDNYPVRFLTPGSGFPRGTPPSITAEFKEMTGRVGFDWKPQLGFTNDTLLYAFYSRGYKGGGPNNIGQVATLRATYDPEFVNAWEVGTKNTLLDGRMTFNAAAFYYDYKGYQVSKFVNRISVTENIDAEIFGAEFEVMWEPIDNLRLNGSLGLLETKILNGESIDPFNRTSRNPNLTFVKTSGAAGCTVPTTALANLVNVIQQGPGAPTVAGVSGNAAAMLGVCSGAFATSFGVTPTDGIPAQLAGNELPGSPPWTVSLGAQYTMALPGGWEATARGDYFRQGDSHSRVFNTPLDELRGWENANISLRVVSEDRGLEFEAFVRNVFNDRSITDVFPVDEALALMPNAVFTEPRIIGVAIQQAF